jgi:prepilin-type N-terminal cleavage/methylation domain-containing protein
MKENSNIQIGVTLAEMLVVVAILAICAALVVPSADSIAPARADAAAAEIARALRFAQREAVRTNEWHQVQVDMSSQTLRVYRLLATGISEDTANPTMHPVDKRKYDISFKDGQTPTITAVSFNYDNGTLGANFVSFGPDGSPGEVTISKKKEEVKDLKTGRITIGYGRQQRFVDVSPVVGRVSISAE